MAILSRVLKFIPAFKIIYFVKLGKVSYLSEL